jgi:hypothetical protein
MAVPYLAGKKKDKAESGGNGKRLPGAAKAREMRKEQLQTIKMKGLILPYVY